MRGVDSVLSCPKASWTYDAVSHSLNMFFFSTAVEAIISTNIKASPSVISFVKHWNPQTGFCNISVSDSDIQGIIATVTHRGLMRVYNDCLKVHF